MKPVMPDGLAAYISEIETLRARIEELEKQIDAARTVCDSYADENQRFHDRIEALEAALTNERERRQANELMALHDRVEALEVACHIAFMAMCAQRDNPDDEVFQDAIDALGMAVKNG